MEILIEVRRIDFQRPRHDVIELIGEENQAAPVLVLDKAAEVPPEAKISEKTGRAFILGSEDAGEYLSRTFGVMRSH
jgi:hypothetical protein